MTMRRIIALSAATVALCVGLWLAYLRALAGEPQAAWLMRDVLGLMQ